MSDCSASDHHHSESAAWHWIASVCWEARPNPDITPGAAVDRPAEASPADADELALHPAVDTVLAGQECSPID